VSYKLVCPTGVVDTTPEGYPVCTDASSNVYAWILEESASPWTVDLSTADVAALLGSALAVFAVVFSVRMVLNVILNKR